MHEGWDADYTGDTRTVDMHICWLGEKIEGDPRHPQLLRTVRGMGYQLEASQKATATYLKANLTAE